MARGGLIFEDVGQIEVQPRKMGGVEGVLVDGIHHELYFHIHQAKKEEGVFYFVAHGGKAGLVFCANGVCPGGGVIHVAQQDVGICGPRRSIRSAYFGVHIEDDGHARFGDFGEVVHSPLVGFVGLFTVDIDETRDISESGFRWCEEILFHPRLIHI